MKDWVIKAKEQHRRARNGETIERFDPAYQEYRGVKQQLLYGLSPVFIRHPYTDFVIGEMKKRGITLLYFSNAEDGNSYRPTFEH